MLQKPLAALCFTLLIAFKSSPAFPQTLPAAPLPDGEVTQIGEWQIKRLQGKLTAIAKAEKSQGEQMAGLWLECTPAKRLEYVPIGLTIFHKVKTLWIDSAGDVFTIPLVNARATGTSAVDISKMLLAEERNAGPKWVMQMSFHSQNGPFSEIQLGGFSKMQTYMLANCKN